MTCAIQRLRKLDDVNVRKLQALAKWDQATHDAVLWLRSHNHLFKMEVIEPPFLCLTVPNKNYVQAVEGCFTGSLIKVGSFFTNLVGFSYFFSTGFCRSMPRRSRHIQSSCEWYRESPRKESSSWSLVPRRFGKFTSAASHVKRGGMHSSSRLLGCSNQLARCSVWDLMVMRLIMSNVHRACTGSLEGSSTCIGRYENFPISIEMRLITTFRPLDPIEWR